MANKPILINGQIHLYGRVGRPADIFDDSEFFTDEDVALALAEIGPRDVVVRINSGGGSAFVGMAIYSLLKAHAGEVTAVCDAIAASAASLIFMAGEKREMRDGSMLMIHDPASITIGPAKDHADAAHNLNKLADNYAAVYAAAAGKPVDKVREQMLATTYFTASEAIAEGFATAIVVDHAEAFAAFDYQMYANAPAVLIKRAGEARAAAASRAAAKTAGAFADATLTRMRMRQAAVI